MSEETAQPEGEVEHFMLFIDHGRVSRPLVPFMTVRGTREEIQALVEEMKDDLRYAKGFTGEIAIRWVDHYDSADAVRERIRERRQQELAMHRAKEKGGTLRDCMDAALEAAFDDRAQS